MSQLGASFDKHQVILLCFLLALLCGNFSLVVQIGLVAYQYDDNIVSSLGSNVIDPFSCVLE